jgi:hypothetical protein
MGAPCPGLRSPARATVVVSTSTPASRGYWLAAVLGAVIACAPWSAGASRQCWWPYAPAARQVPSEHIEQRRAAVRVGCEGRGHPARQACRNRTAPAVSPPKLSSGSPRWATPAARGRPQPVPVGTPHLGWAIRDRKTRALLKDVVARPRGHGPSIRRPGPIFRSRMASWAGNLIPRLIPGRSPEPLMPGVASGGRKVPSIPSPRRSSGLESGRPRRYVAGRGQ